MQGRSNGGVVAGADIVGGVGPQHGHTALFEPRGAGDLASGGGVIAADRPGVQPFAVVARPHQQQVPLLHTDAVGLFGGLQVVRHDRVVGRNPIDAPQRWNVQQNSLGNDAIRRCLDGVGLRSLAGGDPVGGLAVVQLALP